jgi:hypothetical protein
MRPGSGTRPAFRLGTATTVSSGALATFTIDGVLAQVQVARDLTIAVGDVALIARAGQLWVAVCRLYAAAPADVGYTGDVPAPSPASVSGTLVITPASTGSYRTGFGWLSTDDVAQGDPGSGVHTGAAFYGSKPLSLTGATVTAATVRIRRPARGGNPVAQAVTLRLVTEATRPVGAPTLTSTQAGPSPVWDSNTDFTVPTAWAQAIVGGTAGGLAITNTGDPYVLTSGTGDYGPAWAMTLNWTR